MTTYIISYIDDLAAFRLWLETAPQSSIVGKMFINGKNFIKLSMLHPVYEPVPYVNEGTESEPRWVAERQPNKSMAVVKINEQQKLDDLEECQFITMIGTGGTLEEAFDSVKNNEQHRNAYDSVWPYEMQNVYGFKFRNPEGY